MDVHIGRYLFAEAVKVQTMKFFRKCKNVNTFKNGASIIGTYQHFYFGLTFFCIQLKK